MMKIMMMKMMMIIKQIAETDKRCTTRVRLGEPKVLLLVRSQRFKPKTNLKAQMFKAKPIPTMMNVRKKKPDIDSWRRS